MSAETFALDLWLLLSQQSIVVSACKNKHGLALSCQVSLGSDTGQEQHEVDQDMPLSDMLLWHTDDFEMEALEKRATPGSTLCLPWEHSLPSPPLLK